jgi:hypothetical protein
MSIDKKLHSGSFLKDFQQRLESYDHGNLSKRKYIDNILNKYLQETSKLEYKFDLFHSFFKIIQALTPIVFNGFSAYFMKNGRFLMSSLFIVLSVLSIISLGALEAFLPKNFGENKLHAKILKLELSVRKIVAQLLLFDFAFKDSDKDDNELIEKLSNSLHNSVSEVLSNENHKIWDTLDGGSYGYDFEQTKIEIPTLPSNLCSELDKFAKALVDACKIIFGEENEYKAKIYFKTKHNVTRFNKPYEIEILTALGRYPERETNSTINSGCSFVKGRITTNNATVWACTNSRERFMCKESETKSSTKKTHYASILYARLPYGVGVITISCSNSEVFSNANEMMELEIDNIITSSNIAVRDAISKLV